MCSVIPLLCGAFIFVPFQIFTIYPRMHLLVDGNVSAARFLFVKTADVYLSCRFLLKWQLAKQFNYEVELSFYSITLLMKRVEQEINFKSKCLYLLISLKSWINPKLDKNPTVNCLFLKTNGLKVFNAWL